MITHVDSTIGGLDAPDLSDEPAARLRRILGDHADVSSTGGHTLVEPRTEDACARALAVCSANEWAVSVAGSGSWMRERLPAPVRISLRRLDDIVSVRPDDLYTTVGAGVPTSVMADALARQGVWLPIDPPGANRTIGSVLACATQGALRSGYGAVRDNVLGLTVAMGSGRVLRLGGRVVKNVAGFDIGKLVIGGFGAYGIVMAAHLKVRALPAQDVTVQIAGERDRLLDRAGRILQRGLTPAALELSSDGSAWHLTARMMGSAELVTAQRREIDRTGDGEFVELSGESGPSWWVTRRRAASSYPTTIRIGTTTACAVPALGLIEGWPGLHALTFGFGGSTLRWSGSTTADDVVHMRRAAALHAMPVTVERAPPNILARVGHFGALPDGAQQLARGVQQVLDPAEILGAGVWQS